MHRYEKYFCLRPDIANKLVAQDDKWVQETRRCPDNDGVSHPDIANKQMQTVGNDYRARAYSLLTSVHDFAEFTTQGTLQHHL
jgi:hypothetical protein